MKKKKYMCVEDGAWLDYEKITGIFGSAIVQRKTRVLVKSEKPHKFTNEQAAHRAANTATNLANFLKGTMLDGWDKLERFTKRGNISVISE